MEVLHFYINFLSVSYLTKVFLQASSVKQAVTSHSLFTRGSVCAPRNFSHSHDSIVHKDIICTRDETKSSFTNTRNLLFLSLSTSFSSLCFVCILSRLLLLLYYWIIWIIISDSNAVYRHFTHEIVSFSQQSHSLYKHILL